MVASRGACVALLVGNVNQKESRQDEKGAWSECAGGKEQKSVLPSSDEITVSDALLPGEFASISRHFFWAWEHTLREKYK